MSEKKQFAHQTGGHADAFSVSEPGKLTKKVGNAEYEFYTKYQSTSPPSVPFAATFYGSKEEDDKKYVTMEDLTYGFDKPCILDIKMGKSSVGEDATPEKAAKMHAKDMKTTTHNLGFRITCMKVYQKADDSYKKYGKDWSINITKDTVEDGILEFFKNEDNVVRTDVIKAFIPQLKEVQKWVNDQQKFRIYSSSILFVYDATATDVSTVRTRMIDFAHVFEIKDNGHDDGYIAGIATLIDYFNKLSK